MVELGIAVQIQNIGEGVFNFELNSDGGHHLNNQPDVALQLG